MGNVGQVLIGISVLGLCWCVLGIQKSLEILKEKLYKCQNGADSCNSTKK